MSSIAKTSISLSKKDLTKSRIPPVASRNVVFYHKAAGGETTINLNALSMPSEMPTQVQATVDEISGARLTIFKKNLKLTSSVNGELIQGLDYIVVDNYTINLIGPYTTVGAEINEIFVGTITGAPISDLTVASAKTIQKTYTLAVGQTVLNLGLEYKVGEFPSENVGIIKIFANGILLQRNTGNSSVSLDKDYYEVDSGNGYGTTITFNAAPALNPHEVIVDFGVRAITDNNAIGTLESLTGSIKKISDDLAVVAGTSSSDYWSASPSEVERRAFGDMVLGILGVRVPIVEEWTSFVPTSSWIANTTLTGYYRRVGDEIEVNIHGALSGAPTSTTLVIDIPLGLSINTGKIASASTSALYYGWANFTDNGIAHYKGGVSYNTATSVIITSLRQSGATNIDQQGVDQVTPFTWANSDYFDIEFRVPVVGWASTQTIKTILGL